MIYVVVLAGLYALIFGKVQFTPTRRLSGKSARTFGAVLIVSYLIFQQLAHRLSPVLSGPAVNGGLIGAYLVVLFLIVKFFFQFDPPEKTQVILQRRLPVVIFVVAALLFGGFSFWQFRKKNQQNAQKIEQMQAAFNRNETMTADERPTDLTDLIARHERCQHLAGEEANNEERKKFIAAEIQKNQCDSIEGEAQSLRDKYQAQPELVQALDEALNAGG